MLLEEGGETPAEVTLSLEHLISSPRTGIVSDLRGHAPGSEEVADSAGVLSVSGKLATVGAIAGSSAFDARTARVRALGEAVERYALYTAAKWVRTRTMTLAEAGPDALDPREAALPAPVELAELPDFAAFDEQAPIAWVEGWRLLPDGATRRALLPAELALAHYKPAGRRFAWASSSGTGCGNTLAEATRSGLREVLERDAFATAWLLRRDVPQVDLDAARDPDIARWRDHHRARGRRPTLAWLTNEVGFPVVAAQVEEDAPHLRYVAGFGASLDPARAAKRAVEEVEQGRFLLKHLARTNAPIPATEAEATRSLEAQLLYWQDAERAKELAFLTRGERRVRLEDLRDLGTGTPLGDVRATLRLLAARGLKAYALDLTPPELAGRAPLRVVGTLVPGAQPVRMGPRPWGLANPRLGHETGNLHRRPPPFA